MINRCFFYGRQFQRLQHTLPVSSNTDMFVALMHLTLGIDYYIMLRAVTSGGATRTIYKFPFLFALVEH
jgi:hypothetical protein